MKEKIEDELFYMLHEKSLDKITVTELVKKCNVSRQTFYYYFKDVYAVLESIFKRETDSIMNDTRGTTSWKIGYEKLLRWSLNNKEYIMNIMKSVPRKDIEHSVSKKLYIYANAELCRCAEAVSISERQREYIAEFYTLSLTACYIKWIESDMKESPEFEAGRLGLILDGLLLNAVNNFEKLNNQSI